MRADGNRPEPNAPVLTFAFSSQNWIYGVLWATRSRRSSRSKMTREKRRGHKNKNSDVIADWSAYEEPTVFRNG